MKVTIVRKYIMMAATFVAFTMIQPNEAQAQTSPMRCGVENMWWRDGGGNTTYYDQVFCIATENNVRITGASANRGNCPLRIMRSAAVAAAVRFGGGNDFYWYNSIFTLQTLQFGDRITLNSGCIGRNPSILQYSVIANGTSWNWDVTPR